MVLTLIHVLKRLQMGADSPLKEATSTVIHVAYIMLINAIGSVVI